MTTSNGEGSGWLIPGTGVMANNMMGEDDLHPDGFHAVAAGRAGGVDDGAVAWWSAPTARVELVVGQRGQQADPHRALQVIAGVVDQGRPLGRRGRGAPAALGRRRSSTSSRVVRRRRRAPSRRGGRCTGGPQRDLYFGGVHAVAPGRAAAGDPRRGGSTPRRRCLAARRSTGLCCECSAGPGGPH